MGRCRWIYWHNEGGPTASGDGSRYRCNTPHDQHRCVHSCEQECVSLNNFAYTLYTRYLTHILKTHNAIYNAKYAVSGNWQDESLTLGTECLMRIIGIVCTNGIVGPLHKRHCLHNWHYVPLSLISANWGTFTFLMLACLTQAPFSFSYNKMGSFIYFLPISSNKMFEAPVSSVGWNQR